MCNYNFEIPVDPIGLMTMVRQMIIENGGAVTGQIPNVAVTFPTPMGHSVPCAGTQGLGTLGSPASSALKPSDQLHTAKIQQLVFWRCPGTDLDFTSPAPPPEVAV